MIGKRIDQLKVGDHASFTKTISESDVYLFAGVTGDLNPAHVNEVYAQGTMFKTRIAHGMLSGGLISTVMGTLLPGPGSIYLKQDLTFLAPVLIGDTITARGEVAEIMLERNRVRMITTCHNQHGKLVVEGSALIMPPR